jgi:hypothetical protein
MAMPGLKAHVYTKYFPPKFSKPYLSFWCQVCRGEGHFVLRVARGSICCQVQLPFPAGSSHQCPMMR